MNTSDLKCYVCLNKINKPIRINCQHIFCYKCLQLWLITNECLICRKQLKEKLNKYANSKYRAAYVPKQINFKGAQLMLGLITLFVIILFQLIKQFLKK